MHLRLLITQLEETINVTGYQLAALSREDEYPDALCPTVASVARTTNHRAISGSDKKRAASPTGSTCSGASQRVVRRRKGRGRLIPQYQN